MKVYEINFKTLLFPLIIGITAFILFYGINNYFNHEKITYDDTIGLNQIRSNYASGTYEEIVIQ